MQEYLKKFIQKISTLFTEISLDSEAWSMMRFLSWFCVIFPLFVWGFLCFIKFEILDIPMGVVAVIGLGITGKVAQKQIESRNEINMNHDSEENEETEN